MFYYVFATDNIISHANYWIFTSQPKSVKILPLFPAYRTFTHYFKTSTVWKTYCHTIILFSLGIAEKMSKSDTQWGHCKQLTVDCGVFGMSWDVALRTTSQVSLATCAIQTYQINMKVVVVSTRYLLNFTNFV